MEKEIQKAFSNWGQDDEKLASNIEELSHQWGDEIYREALRILVNKDFEAARAKYFWTEALNYGKQLFPNKPTGYGLRSALLNYLQQVAKEIQDPRIIEAEFLENITQSSVTDGLTGLYCQSYFTSHLDKLLSAQRRPSVNRFAVILLDLDHFSKYNDQFGKKAGDKALCLVSESIRHTIRQGDVASRFEGQKFALLLHRMNFQQAFTVAERIRSSIEKIQFQQGPSDEIKLTISGGIALYPEDGDTAADLLKNAEEELKKAKGKRNTISPTRRGRRQTSRHKIQSVVEVALPKDDSFSTGLTFDISSKGMQLGCDKEFQPESTLKLNFRKPFWPVNREVIATVRHISEDFQTGIVRLGLEFENSSDDIRELLPWEKRNES